MLLARILLVEVGRISDMKMLSMIARADSGVEKWSVGVPTYSAISRQSAI